MRLPGGQADGFRKVLDRCFQLLTLKVQLPAVLEGLPQLRAEADAFRQQGNRLVGCGPPTARSPARSNMVAGSGTAGNLRLTT